MRAEAEAVVRRLRAAGHEAYLVGGGVRDLLLGRTPSDWDVATSATPEAAAPLFESVREVGRHFGVLQVHSGSAWIEVATFRSEGPYSDGRHPDSVTFTDAAQDAARRDFTVNALFLDPDTGAVLDFVGGRADLEARRLRAVGDPEARFAEDALRLLRAVRFACTLDFRIEAATWRAMQAHAAGLRRTSAERIRDEFLAILTGPAPRRGIELLDEAGLLQMIAPEIVALHGVAQSPDHHPEGDVWEHTLRMLERMRDPDAILALGVLLHDIGKPATHRLDPVSGKITFYGHPERGAGIATALLDRWRVPVRVRDAVLALIGQHMRFLDAPRMKASTRRRFVLQEHFDAILELHRLDRQSASGDLTTWELCRDELAGLAAAPVSPLRPLLSGDDLLALGYAPGPRLGRILHALVDAQLEGAVADRDAALAWLRRNVPPPDAGTAAAPGEDGGSDAAGGTTDSPAPGNPA
jgi:poly(A) polymerase